MPGPPHQPVLRVDLQGAKEQRCACGGGHRGQVCDRSKGRHGIRKDSLLIIAEGKDYKLPMWITSNRIETSYMVLIFPMLSELFLFS